MKLRNQTKKLLALLGNGQLIVPGGGVTIRQLTTGQYEIRTTSSDLANNQQRTPGSGDPGDVPGVPITPVPRPPKPLIPPGPEPEPEPDEYGTVSGGSGDDSTNGDPTKPDEPDPPYDFNQRGWQWYQDNWDSW